MELPLSSQSRRVILQQFLAEDVGAGDRTTEAIVPENSIGEAQFESKSHLVLAGMELALETFQLLDPKVEARAARRDGESIRVGEILAEISGRARALLTAERVALNLLQRLCGIATLTRRFVDAVAGTGAEILDTRKTTPGLRAFEKYAVRAGGGRNHRMGLDDAILIKDNHVRIAGGIAAAIRAASAKRDGVRWLEVEVTNMAELEEAVAERPDVILVDNFNPAQARDAVAAVRARHLQKPIRIEASGGITLETVREFAEAGVDWISVGALTHSAPASDISLEITAS